MLDFLTTAFDRNRMLTALFSLSLFSSAALMFSLQPMIGKMLLPLVGGTPAGWIVAVAFFQIALLVGYLLAYALSGLTPRRHAAAYLLLLALGASALPVAISSETPLQTLDAWTTVCLLTAAIGLPFVALATTSTTLQRLFTATRHPHAQNPYFLYAASNLGSFAGLLLYPFLFEPQLTLREQSEGWFILYGGLLLLALLCVFALRKPPIDDQDIIAPKAQDQPAATLSWRQALIWVAAAFIPASLLMGYTSFITRDIYSAPLIWVVPLATYLLTFVVAFRTRPLLTARSLEKWHLVAVALSLAMVALSASALRTSLQPIVLHMLALAVIALAFHLRLYESRPVAQPRQLAGFYLLISLGGALAGAFNAFVAPLIFDTSFELPLILIVSLLFSPALLRRFQTLDYALLAFTVLVCAAYVFALYSQPHAAHTLLVFSALALLPAALHPRILLISGILVIGIYQYSINKNALVLARNFYGSITVYDHELSDPATGETHHVRALNHGTTLHGFQLLAANRQLTVTAYYAPVQHIFMQQPPQKALVMGLGVGTMACLAAPQTQMTFIEIDPGIIDAARSHFSYLSDCQPQRQPRVILGDGRLELAKLQDETFGVIAIDVFSSDYIPSHLMTREALALYLERLTPDGILLFHISNNFFDLAPALGALAQDAGVGYRLRETITTRGIYERPSRWIAISRSKAKLAHLSQNGWTTPDAMPKVALWTDDYSDYLGALRADVFAFKRWLRTDPASP